MGVQSFLGFESERGLVGGVVDCVLAMLEKDVVDNCKSCCEYFAFLKNYASSVCGEGGAGLPFDLPLSFSPSLPPSLSLPLSLSLPPSLSLSLSPCRLRGSTIYWRKMRLSPSSTSYSVPSPRKLKTVPR